MVKRAHRDLYLARRRKLLVFRDNLFQDIELLGYHQYLLFLTEIPLFVYKPSQERITFPEHRIDPGEVEEQLEVSDVLIVEVTHRSAYVAL